MKYFIFLFIVIFSSCSFKFGSDKSMANGSSINSNLQNANIGEDSANAIATNGIAIPTAQPFRFYVNYETFLTNIPIPEYEIYLKESFGGYEVVNLKKIKRQKGTEVINYDKLSVKKDGKEMQLKSKDFPTLFFTDANGLLYRVFDGDSYLIYIKGKYCYYVSPYSHPVRSQGNGKFEIVGQNGYGSGHNYQNSSFPSMYWSIGIDGPIKEIKDKEFEAELAKYGLDEKYKSKKVKRELNMGAIDYGSKKHKVYVEFFDLLNNQ